MTQKGKTDAELWRALEGLDDDLLDPNLPEATLDEELRTLGVDPAALAARASAFVAATKEAERLSWQKQAEARRTQLEARAARSSPAVPTDMTRAQVLARLDALRATDPNLGSTIRMAARKRKPEESTDDELRALLVELEALRAVEREDTE